MREIENHPKPERIKKLNSPPPNKEGVSVTINQKALQNTLIELGISRGDFDLIFVQGGGFSLLDAKGEKYKINLRAEVSLPAVAYCAQLTHDLNHELYHIHEDPTLYPKDSPASIAQTEEKLAIVKDLDLTPSPFDLPYPLFDIAEWYADSKCKSLDVQPAPIFQMASPPEVHSEPKSQNGIVFVNKTRFRYGINWKVIRHFFESFPQNRTPEIKVIFLPTEKFADYFYALDKKRWIVCIPTIPFLKRIRSHQEASVQLLQVFLQIRAFQLRPEIVADYKLWRKAMVEAEEAMLSYKGRLLTRRAPSLVYLY